MDPYRILFPIGLTYAVFGAGLWPLHAIGVVAYPRIAHRLLMIQGFEQSFVLGFLLTAMPGLTKGTPCRPAELAVAALAMLAFGVASLWGAVRVAELAYLVSLALLVVALGRRVARSTHPKPAEMLFVGFGLALGLIGAVMSVTLGDPSPLAGRLLSLGLVLSLVLGLGGMLVPKFAGMREPLAILAVAQAGDVRRRLVFYAAVLFALAGAFGAEALGHGPTGAWLRATAATAMIALVWKGVRPPGRSDVPAFALWSAGWLIVTGLWIMAIAPRFALGGLHVVFIGGFGLLTLGIATRVVVGHGRHPQADDRRVLSPVLVLSIVAALLARLAAEWWPGNAPAWLAAGGALWVVGWTAWAVGALPRIGRLGDPPIPAGGTPVQITSAPAKDIAPTPR